MAKPDTGSPTEPGVLGCLAVIIIVIAVCWYFFFGPGNKPDNKSDSGSSTPTLNRDLKGAGEE